jgi:hypothetical protein
VSLDELALLRQTVLLSDDDERYLRMAGDVLRPQTEEILDVWYGFVAAHPHLVQAFAGADGQPVGAYLEAVRRRFGQWIADTCDRPYDQAWLDYQYEVGLRHHRSKKNQADGVQAEANIPLRYVLTLAYPIMATVKPFLGRAGHSAEDVEAMHQAWCKSVLLQVTLWSQPYVRDGDF